MKKVSIYLTLLLIFGCGMKLSAQVTKAHNPVIFADVPDMSMIRVGDTYYMSSTTMHMSPGLPLMKSKDLVNWQTFRYAYDTLANMDELNLTNGKSTYGTTSIDLKKMKEGDFAGLCVLQKNYGQIGVKVENGAKSIVMISAGTGKPMKVQRVPLSINTIFFKIECDFREKTDLAYFYYSLDGKDWKSIGEPLKMAYTLPHFMGYRFGLFNYATKNVGGYADFDFFRIEDKISRMK